MHSDSTNARIIIADHDLLFNKVNSEVLAIFTNCLGVNYGHYNKMVSSLFIDCYKDYQDICKEGEAYIGDVIDFKINFNKFKRLVLLLGNYNFVDTYDVIGFNRCLENLSILCKENNFNSVSIAIYDLMINEHLMFDRLYYKKFKELINLHFDEGYTIYLHERGY